MLNNKQSNTTYKTTTFEKRLCWKNTSVSSKLELKSLYLIGPTVIISYTIVEMQNVIKVKP